jgi:hypothetical protein
MSAADDMVASLTLRLRDQMSAGVDEIKANFNGLKGTLDSLTGVLNDLRDTLASLKTPATMIDGLEDTKKMATDTAAAVRDIGVAATQSGEKMRAMKGGGGFHGPANAGHAADWFGGALAGYMGLGAIKSFADFQNTELHISITDKLSGQAAVDEQNRLTSMLDPLAQQTATSSSDLADAYLFLVTTGMKRSLIDQMMPALAQASTAYNIAPGDMTQAAFALNQNLGIAPQQMLQGLGTLAYAAKIGHFSMADFSALLPDVSGQMQIMGMGGMKGVVEGASALEIMRRYEGQAAPAENDLKELLMYMHSPMGNRMFDMTSKMKDLLGPAGRALLDKYHIKPLDLPAYLNSERAKGIDPVNAIADYFHTMLAGISSPTDQANLVGDLIHNHQAQSGIIALVQQYDDFKKDQLTLTGVNPATVQTDFTTAMQASGAQVRIFDENMAQLERDLGQGLLPLLTGVNGVLKPFLSGINYLNQNFKLLGQGSGNLLLGITASYVALKTLAGVFTTGAGTIRAALGLSTTAAAAGGEAGAAGAAARTGLLAASDVLPAVFVASVLKLLYDKTAGQAPDLGNSGSRFIGGRGAPSGSAGDPLHVTVTGPQPRGGLLGQMLGLP